MNKNSPKIIFLFILLATFSALSSFTLIKPVAAQSALTWWNPNWLSRVSVNLTETAGVDRVSEPTDVHVTFESGTCTDPVKEVRVVYLDGATWTEVPSQVYNVTTAGGYAKSANVVFLANVPAYSTTTYYIYYNNPAAEAPTYDGLRLHTEEAGDTYNVTAVKDGVEKIYFRIFWKHAITLYSDGKNITFPGGQAGWELFTISFANLWVNAKDFAWFSSSIGEKLKVVNSGPLFIDFENTQPICSDLWGSVYNSNISSTYQIRVYYQPDLNPLVKYRASLTWKNVETVKNLLFMDFKLSNSTSSGNTEEDWTYAIYKGFTWKNTDGVVQTVPVETTVADLIWSPADPVGWWSYNGSRSDSTTKPGADIGMIPTYAGGTISGSEYAINITQLVEYNDNHASPWVQGTYDGNTGDTIETTGYIVTNTPADQNIAPTMEDEATKLRNPLERNVGSGFTISIQVALEPREIYAPPLTIGDTFTLNVTIRNVVGLHAWQVGLTWNPDILEAVTGSIEEGSFLTSAGNTQFLAGTINNDTGILAPSNATLTGAGVSKSGNGTLMSVDFYIKKAGDCTIRLTDVLLLDESGMNITYGTKSASLLYLLDKTPPVIMDVIPSLAGQEIDEQSELNVNTTVIDNSTVHSLTGLTINASGVSQVLLNYSTDGGVTWNTTTMTKIEGTDIYQGAIPGFKAGTKVRYNIVATDNDGNAASSPTYWYKVRSVPQTGTYFIFGVGVGFVFALIIAGAGIYARRKPG